MLENLLRKTAVTSKIADIQPSSNRLFAQVPLENVIKSTINGSEILSDIASNIQISQENKPLSAKKALAKTTQYACNTAAIGGIGLAFAETAIFGAVEIVVRASETYARTLGKIVKRTANVSSKLFHSTTGAFANPKSARKNLEQNKLVLNPQTSLSNSMKTGLKKTLNFGLMSSLIIGSIWLYNSSNPNYHLQYTDLDTNVEAELFTDWNSVAQDLYTMSYIGKNTSWFKETCDAYNVSPSLMAFIYVTEPGNDFLTNFSDQLKLPFQIFGANPSIGPYQVQVNNGIETFPELSNSEVIDTLQTMQGGLEAACDLLSKNGDYSSIKDPLVVADAYSQYVYGQSVFKDDGSIYVPLQALNLLIGMSQHSILTAVFDEDFDVNRYTKFISEAVVKSIDYRKKTTSEFDNYVDESVLGIFSRFDSYKDLDVLQSEISQTKKNYESLHKLLIR